MTSRSFLKFELLQISRFFSVGVLATLVHLVVSISLVFIFGIFEQVSNLIAFGAAFGVSFVGHYTWTFKSHARLLEVFPCFAAVALSGFLGSAIVLHTLHSMQFWTQEFRVTVAALAVPAITYFGHKLLVFKK
ncbi:MAG: GtrA family protein [Hyphomicrobiales bacterium]|nr:GtrA family protein [Hyphomicrobiales bacterium]